jgi:ferredoxin
MMEKIIQKSAFPQWLKSLQAFKIFLPKRASYGWELSSNHELQEIPEDYTYPVVPPKKLIFPQEEIFFEFEQNPEDGIKLKEILPEAEQQVIFGVRPCDGRAVKAMDLVFGGTYEDPYYWRRRRQTVLVGLACSQPPSENCFCLSVEGSPSSEEGLDILLTDLGDRYFVKAITEHGKSLLSAASSLFSEPGTRDREAREKIHLEAEKKIKRHLPSARELPERIKAIFDSDFWDEESLNCLRCGICTYLCPTCHCFDINDETKSLAPLRGRRVRTWDTCQFPDFTMHSSGHNPRPDRASRLRQRLSHKFLYFILLFDRFQCVGCGRCVTLCPVGIDIIEVLTRARNHGA